MGDILHPYGDSGAPPLLAPSRGRHSAPWTWRYRHAAARGRAGPPPWRFTRGPAAVVPEAASSPRPIAGAPPGSWRCGACAASARRSDRRLRAPSRGSRTASGAPRRARLRDRLGAEGLRTRRVLVHVRETPCPTRRRAAAHRLSRNAAAVPEVRHSPRGTTANLTRRVEPSRFRWS